MSDFVAFINSKCVAQGSRLDIARALRRVRSRPGTHAVFDLETGAEVDFDLTGSDAEVSARYAEGERRRGRPKLGVIAREVTMLPLHWDWLNEQRGGASATLRQLVDAARRADGGAAEAANAKAAAYRLISAMAGDWPNFEEAARSLFADDLDAFAAATNGWSGDVAAVALTRWRGTASALSV